MTRWEQTRHQVAIDGLVTDATTGVPLGGVRVEISAAPAAFSTWLAAYALQYGAAWAGLDQRPDRTRSREDGRFYLLDLPDGQYTLTASWPEQGSRYGSAQAQATVVRSTGGTIARSRSTLALPSTTLRGQILGRGGAPVALAEIRLRGQISVTRSDEQGRYLLSGLEAGRGSVVVAASGYATKEVAIESQAGLAQTFDITL